MKITELLLLREQPTLKKILRIMRLTVVLLLLGCMHVYADGFSQSKISLRLQQTDLKQALSAIEKQSSVRFLYNQDVLKRAGKVSANASNAAIAQVLDQLLEGTGITYKILDDELVVLNFDGYQAEQIRVTGKITGPDGQPVSGASVTIKGSKAGVAADAAGNYAINATTDATLTVTALGFASQDIPVNGRAAIDIALQAAAQNDLNTVVVVGYGSQRKLDVTGSVAQVKGEEIAKQPGTNAVSSLQGKVAGVQISNSGAPGASPLIRIRGLGTVYGAQSPLYVVDGVWFDDINFLNPNDIQDISILKDASAQSIYGVRAANGVVLVTTKKGKGRATVTYSGHVGMQRVTKQVEMANGTEYATLINEMNMANGNAAPFSNPSSYGTGTNWFDVVLRNAMITNHHIAVAGGTEKSTYNFSIGYLYQEGIVHNNDYNRITARLQNDITVFSPLKVGYTAIFESNRYHDAAGGVIYKAFTAAPVVPVRYADGSYGDPADYPIGSATNNPQAQLDFFNQRSRGYRITGNVYGELRIAQGLNFRTSFGGEFGQSDSRNYNPVYAANSIQFNNLSKLTIGKGETRNWILENTLTWDKTFGDHKVKVLVGQSAQRYKSYSLTGSAENVPNSSEGDMYIALGNTSNRTISDGGSLATYASYFGRVNYSFMNRYLLNASVRADGSSKFSGDQRWGYFPSVGAGWVISDEGFMRNQKTFNNLKLRGSWGIVGNASVPPNLSVLTVNQSAGYTAIYNGVANTGASITTIVPPVIFWEKGIGTDIGLEGSLLNRRLTFEVDWYNRKTQDAIFDIPIVGSLGLSTSTIRGNQADFENQGWEFSLGWNDNTQKLGYTINANFSVNNNKVLKVVTGNNPIYGGGAAATGGQLSTRTIFGQPIGQFFGLMVDGIFQNAAEVAASAQKTAKPGDFKYRDISGPAGKPDGIINALDRVVLGNPNPKYTFGLNTNFNYGGFDLTVDLQGIAGVDVYNANKGLRYGSENFSKDFYDKRWHGEGTSNTYPSANVGGGTNYLPNSWFVEDGGYVRFRNIQLGYALNSSLMKKWGMQRIRFYVNAQNAINFFKYTGFTPEISAGGPTDGGIDNGIYPLSATYNFGVNVTF